MFSGSPRRTNVPQLVLWGFVHQDKSIRRRDLLHLTVPISTTAILTSWSWAVSEPTVPTALRSGIPHFYHMAQGTFCNHVSFLCIFLEMSSDVCDILPSDFGCLL